MRRIVLNFHGLGQPERELEPDEAAYWLAPEVFPETLALADRHRDTVATEITFDDGNISDIAIGAEALARHGWSAEFFVLSARIGAPGSLGAAEIAELAAAGHGIGTHGADHVDWKALDGAGRARELDTAREHISAVAGSPVTSAALPFGRYDRRVLNALRQRGYDRVYSSDKGDRRPGQFPIPRHSLTAAMSMADIEAILLGRVPVARRLRRRLATAVKKRL